jgi:hypothetical protein
MTFRMYMKGCREIYKPLAVAESERQAYILGALGYSPIPRQEYVQIALMENVSIPEPLPDEPVCDVDQPTQMRLF